MTRRPQQTLTQANEMAATQAQLAERTADLQRMQAEYANYRKRVERDRIAVREQALANVLAELLPVLDDIGRAREHGELVGGFKSVAESLEAAVAKLGLVSFGDKGEPFDPTMHEALMHSYSDRRHRADLRADPAARLQGRRAHRSARRGSPSRSPAAIPARGRCSGGRRRRTVPRRCSARRHQAARVSRDDGRLTGTRRNQ